ncbi:LysR family transcriptional regulator [Actinokineospora terrae]|uniref:DNA-binding transcriptional regulator, LysR family n=1 Tax=Actinokineospora terrae TaxID=155974 RepID=A0A1H9T0K3_9PSEU|nr:DNA-binding transcriptional regulator, LysR family [Actinokineospora terrae]
MIDPRHLRTVRALGDHGTVIDTAAALHLTPSAVSQQLASLARSAGCAILERHGRRVVLTEAGKVLLNHAETILEQIERAHTDLRHFQQRQVSHLRISAFPTAIAGFVAEAVARLGVRLPGWHVEIEEAETDESLTLLLDHDVDLAVVMITPNQPGLADHRIELLPLAVENYCAVLPTGHPLAGSAPIRLADLAAENWVLSRHTTSCREVVASACAMAGFQPRVKHHATDFAAAVGIVAAGLGVTVVPELGLPPILPESVRIQAIASHTPKRQIAAAIRRNSDHGELVEMLRSAATDRCDSRVEEAE